MLHAKQYNQYIRDKWKLCCNIFEMFKPKPEPEPKNNKNTCIRTKRTYCNVLPAKNVLPVTHSYIRYIRIHRKIHSFAQTKFQGVIHTLSSSQKNLTKILRKRKL